MILHLNISEDKELRNAILSEVRAAIKSDIRNTIKDTVNSAMEEKAPKINEAIDKFLERVKNNAQEQIDWIVCQVDRISDDAKKELNKSVALVSDKMDPFDKTYLEKISIEVSKRITDVLCHDPHFIAIIEKEVIKNLVEAFKNHIEKN